MVTETNKPAEVRIGQFRAGGEGKLMLGELRVDGSESTITLRDDDFFNVSADEPHITGTLYDQTKITLADCIRLSSSRSHVREGIASCSVTLFPHFVLEGRAHLNPSLATIRELHFTFEDAPILFYDFDSFGSLIDARPYIATLTQANEREFKRQIRTGPEPQIAYFAGQRVIVDVPTAIGRIRAQHAPTFALGGPRGVRIDNQIWICITGDRPITLDQAVDGIASLLRFIAISVGRAQTLPVFSIDIGSSEAPEILKVHWSHHPQRPPHTNGRHPHPADNALDPIESPDEFSKVLSNWIAFDGERRVARMRSHESFVQSNHYSTDRLVGAANAFDLLPESAVPKRIKPPADVLEAKRLSKALFRKLPDGDERESLLRALGRIGHATLKQKVRHRAGIIAGATSNRFPSIDWICEQAVECRNHFVHGSSVTFPLNGPWNAIGFLTDTLDFVFVASDLIECGWNIDRFLGNPNTGSQALGHYCANYNANLQRLRDSIAPQSDVRDDG